MKKLEIFVAFILTVIITTAALIFVDDLFKTEKPDNLMISHELVIHNTGKFSALYVDEIKLDRGDQPFGLSAEVKRNDLHLYVLAHKTAEGEVNEYVEWIVNYYGAEEVQD